MLRTKQLPKILESVLQDGIYGAVLMTSEGSVICSRFLGDDLMETVLAAISSTIWSNYNQGLLSMC